MERADGGRNLDLLECDGVFSGARPSSGAASPVCSNTLDFTDTLLALDAAAPEDGRAPNPYPARSSCVELFDLTIGGWKPLKPAGKDARPTRPLVSRVRFA
jgi:hypothetical protein